MRILIAEDDPAITDLLVEFLGGAGHQIAVAGSIAAAFRLLDSQPWDVVLADLLLPGGDGLTLAEAARARGLPVLLCTGQPRPAAAASGIGYLQKPYSLGDLLATLTAQAA